MGFEFLRFYLYQGDSWCSFDPERRDFLFKTHLSQIMRVFLSLLWPCHGHANYYMYAILTRLFTYLPSYPQAVKSIATTVCNFSNNSQVAITFYLFWLPSSCVASISLDSCAHLFFSGLFPNMCSVVCVLLSWKCLQTMKAILMWI